MSYTAGVVLACLAMLILVGMIHQAWTYWRGQQIISRRLFILRMLNGTLLSGCLGLIFTLSIKQFTDLRLALLIYTGLTLLPVVVLILAWLDLREIRRLEHLRQAELYRNLADIESELKKQQGRRE